MWVEINSQSWSASTDMIFTNLLVSDNSSTQNDKGTIHIYSETNDGTGAGLPVVKIKNSKIIDNTGIGIMTENNYVALTLENVIVASNGGQGIKYNGHGTK